MFITILASEIFSSYSRVDTMLKRIAVALLAVVALVGSVDRASAQAPYCASGYNPWMGGGYNLYIGETLPYYAMFPPVYYSQPVARTYGYSPYAYPPGTMTPEVVVEQPMTITNPHAAPKAAPQSNGKPAEKVKAVSLESGMEMPDRVQVIVNPYANPKKSNSAAY
jgi:hypothetical protein